MLSEADIKRAEQLADWELEEQLSGQRSEDFDKALEEARARHKARASLKIIFVR